MMMPLVILGFDPLSITCLIGFYVVLARPIWFLTLVSEEFVLKNIRSESSGGQAAEREQLCREGKSFSFPTGTAHSRYRSSAHNWNLWTVRDHHATALVL